METFVMQKNIERYRRILADPREMRFSVEYD
jgi:hypothetical protein